MPNSLPPDRPPQPPAQLPAWLNATVWRRIGYWGTAAWMLAILFATGGNTGHALFQFIFVVPLAAWVVGLVLAGFVRRWRARSAAEAADPGKTGGDTPGRAGS